MTATIKAIADQYSGAACYLDGVPAKIVGRANEFATVAALNSAAAVQYSWHAVNRIMRDRGRFFETK
jgi:hypothetical protein